MKGRTVGRKAGRWERRRQGKRKEGQVGKNEGREEGTLQVLLVKTTSKNTYWSSMLYVLE